MKAELLVEGRAWGGAGAGRVTAAGKPQPWVNPSGCFRDPIARVLL